MATRQYNVGKGLHRDKNVTEAVGSAISSGLVQVTVDLAVTANKREVLQALDAIERYIRKGKWPAA